MRRSVVPDRPTPTMNGAGGLERRRRGSESLTRSSYRSRLYRGLRREYDPDVRAGRIIGVVSGALLALGAGTALAGSEPDPDTGDSILGTSGGLRYASDSEAFNLGNSGFASANTGCGPDDWHIVGGGVELSGPSAKNRTIGSTAQYDWYDLDSVPEDGWRSSGYGGDDGTLKSVSICKAEPQPDYLREETPDSDSNVRSDKVACGGGKAIAGGGFIATSESFLSHSYPYDDSDSNSAPDDGWAVRLYDTVGGLGGMHVDVVCQSGSVSYEDATDNAASHGSASATANCPSGAHVSGGGGKIAGPGAKVNLASSNPIDDSDSNPTPDDGWKAVAYNGSGDQQKLTAYAVCLG